MKIHEAQRSNHDAIPKKAPPGTFMTSKASIKATVAHATAKLDIAMAIARRYLITESLTTESVWQCPSSSRSLDEVGGGAAPGPPVEPPRPASRLRGVCPDLPGARGRRRWLGPRLSALGTDSPDYLG
jgi:hypothetical protein